MTATNHQGQLQSPRGRPAASQTSVASKNVKVKATLVAQVLGELLWHVLPAWAKPSLTMRRTQRFAILLTSLLSTCFLQAVVFVTGDGCHHVPWPAVCRDDGASFDLGAIFRAIWGFIFSCLPTLLFFFLFRKAPRYKKFTTDEQELQVRWWMYSERLGWVLLIIVHGSLILFLRGLPAFPPPGQSEEVVGRFPPVQRLHSDRVSDVQSPLLCPVHFEQMGISRQKDLVKHAYMSTSAQG